MDNAVIFKLAEENPNMSDIDRLVNIYHLLSQVLVFGVPGEIVELGCNEGKTTLFLAMIRDFYSPEREIHVYDSFEGLPARGAHDSYLNEGDCKATVSQLEENFNRWGLGLPAVHKGWFEDTLPTGLPNEIAFAYLDSDFYESIMISLQTIYPRLARNAVVVIDDYCDLTRNPRAWPGLPGVKKACDDFLADKPEQVAVLVGSGDLTLGYFRKL